jgi:hypothetical protein
MLSRKALRVSVRPEGHHDASRASQARRDGDLQTLALESASAQASVSESSAGKADNL